MGWVTKALCWITRLFRAVMIWATLVNTPTDRQTVRKHSTGILLM